MPRLRLALLCVCSALLAACVTSDKPVDLGNGVTGYHIVCSGIVFSTNGDCETRASYLCGDGYTVLKEADPPYAHNEHFWKEGTHDITIACNNPQSQPPQFQ